MNQYYKMYFTIQIIAENRFLINYFHYYYTVF